MGVSNEAGLSEPAALPGENAGDSLTLAHPLVRIVLAEQIYRLLKEEARLERERLGGRRTW